MSGPWISDWCGSCHSDADRHPWCAVAKTLVCTPCGDKPGHERCEK